MTVSGTEILTQAALVNVVHYAVLAVSLAVEAITTRGTTGGGRRGGLGGALGGAHDFRMVEN